MLLVGVDGGVVTMLWLRVYCRVNSTLFAVLTGFSNVATGTGFAASYMTRRLTIGTVYVLVDRT